MARTRLYWIKSWNECLPIFRFVCMPNQHQTKCVWLSKSKYPPSKYKSTVFILIVLYFFTTCSSHWSSHRYPQAFIHYGKKLNEYKVQQCKKYVHTHINTLHSLEVSHPFVRLFKYKWNAQHSLHSIGSMVVHFKYSLIKIDSTSTPYRHKY